MKKLLFVLAVLLVAMSANAQVTWNVRAGGGVFQTEYYNYHYHYGYYDWERDNVPCAALALQVNMPFKRTSRFTFSPTFMAACSRENRIEFPLYLGYKLPIGNRSLFFPKIGPMVGYDVRAKSAISGPSMELAFEIEHFIVAANLSLNCVTREYEVPLHVGAYLTFGYKF